MTGNKMSGLGDNSDCFTDFLTNVIYMKFPIGIYLKYDVILTIFILWDKN